METCIHGGTCRSDCLQSVLSLDFVDAAFTEPFDKIMAECSVVRLSLDHADDQLKTFAVLVLTH